MKNILILVYLLGGLVAFAQPSPPSAIEDLKRLNKTEYFTPAPKKEPSFESVVVGAFKNANTKVIARFFLENLDLKILEKENLYSKSQAELILKDFFADHIPSDFQVIHKGKAGQTEYLIGDLILNKKTYSVQINSKITNQVQYITNLSITEN